MSKTSSKKQTRKKRGAAFKKSPEAPKRFRSSYILFFTHIHDSVKKALPQDQASAPLVSKKAAEMWKNLPQAQRQYWDDMAAKEKEHFLKQKETYNGPWKVPNKRAKKDPRAPKRNPSAFLLFATTRRNELREMYNHLENTAISRILGHEWRTMSPAIKSLYVNQERAERDAYKEKMKKWKRDEVLREIECTELCSPAEVKNAFHTEEGDEEECDDAHVNILLKTLAKVKTSCTSRDLLEISVDEKNETNQTQIYQNAENPDKNCDQQELLSCIKEDLIEPAFQTNSGAGTNLISSPPTNNAFSPIIANREYDFVQNNHVARHDLNFRTIDNSIIFTSSSTHHGNGKHQPPSVFKVNDCIMQSFGTKSGGLDAMTKYHFSSCFTPDHPIP